MNATARHEPDTIDVLIELTWRLALAIDKLKVLAAACEKCGGKGETETRWHAHTMTDSPLVMRGSYGYQRRARLKRYGARAEVRSCCLAIERKDCAACAGIRATIKTCEGPPR